MTFVHKSMVDLMKVICICIVALLWNAQAGKVDEWKGKTDIWNYFVVFTCEVYAICFSCCTLCGVIVKRMKAFYRTNRTPRGSIRAFLLLPCINCQVRKSRSDESIFPRVTLEIEPIGLSRYLFVRKTAEGATGLLMIFTGFCNYGYWFSECF